MAKLSLRHIYKVYPNGTKAVNDFNMEIEDNEFIVFVGPSGCGKSTTLRMIAGLEQITAGELFIGEDLVNDVEPKDRDIAMVFQNYALYPHMNVYDNMAFGLRLRHIPADEIHRKVLWAADALKLTELLNRKPRQMSGGQRQRVALGRAILRNPKVFLLDEPLSNLDAKLRTEMRAEIAKLHSELKTTFIYVTHDQVEAMTLGSRVVVMKLGFVQQIDTPQNLYEYPENKFVAGFIGTPQMNFFEATLKRDKDKVYATFDYCDNKLTIPFADLLKVRPTYLRGDKHVYVGLRCEDISLDPEVIKKSHNIMKIKVSHFEELGNETLVYGDLNMGGDGYSESSTRVIIKSYHGALSLKPGDVVDAAFNMKKAHFFSKEDENTILPRVPTENVFDADVKDNTLKFLGLSVKLPPAIKVEDVKDAELLIPVEAIKVGSGNISAKVERIEEIKDTKLAYLKIGERTFFAIVDNKVKAGTNVKIDIDFKLISLSKDNKNVVEKLSSFDSFIGGFTNLENFGRTTNSLIKHHRANLLEKAKEINNNYQKQLAELGDKKFAMLTLKKERKEYLETRKAKFLEDLGLSTGLKQDKKILAEEYKKDVNAYETQYKKKLTSLQSGKGVSEKQKLELINEAKKEYNLYLKDFNAYVSLYKPNATSKLSYKDKAAITKIKNEYKKNVSKLAMEKNKEIASLRKTDPEYTKKLKEIKCKYSDLMFNAKDERDAKLEQYYPRLKYERVVNSRKREIFKVRDEYADVISNLYKEQAKEIKVLSKDAIKSKNEYNRVLSKLTIEKNKEIASIKPSDPERASKLNEVNQKYLDLINKAKSETVAYKIKETKKKYSKLVLDAKKEREKKLDLVTTESKVFYAYINGHYILAPTSYTLKIVQALGIGLFSSLYRYEVNHDAYILGREDGFKVKVEEILDYGKERFALSKVIDKTIYIKVDEHVNPGDTLSLSIDIGKVRIYENRFDIRLI